MSALTALGFPYPQLTDDNNPPADLQALAQALDDYINAELDPAPYAIISSASDTSAITNSETATLVIPSTTYKANRAYSVWVGGGAVYSANSAFSSWNIKKGTTTSGAVVLSYPRHTSGAATGGNEMHLNFQGVFTVGNTDVTTQLVLCVACNSTNTVVHHGSSTGNPRHVTVRRAGAASKWSGMPVLS